jgi:leader peptidase (prepilin peptidase)/N-methyltransferase
MLETLASPAVLLIFAAIAGLLVGSFLNVVIYRLPKMMERDFARQCAEYAGKPLQDEPALNLVSPRSHCPHCRKPVHALENVPIASYLALKGKCSGCGAVISPRYPVIEAVSALFSVAIAWKFGFTLATVAALVFCWTLIALTMIDVDTQLLPDSLTLPLVWLGLLVNLNGTFTDLRSAVIGAAAGYLLLWAVYWCFKWATGKEGMGYGDFKLLAAIGAWLGWQVLPLVILLSSLVGAVIGITFIALGRQGRDTPIPFGPYLAAAGVVALFQGENLVRIFSF